jgi:hypothetical protein
MLAVLCWLGVVAVFAAACIAAGRQRSNIIWRSEK